ncbi:hypothetical protein D3C73_1431840 [compost metagenome]
MKLADLAGRTVEGGTDEDAEEVALAVEGLALELAGLVETRRVVIVIQTDQFQLDGVHVHLPHLTLIPQMSDKGELDV